ncbi:hypothetical protein FPV67DRAFT_1720363 [Lyophyllum atratum]|nr:hypothetical protein FPV67DRAFT_1720363 [Lyophyllum atratum]
MPVNVHLDQPAAPANAHYRDAMVVLCLARAAIRHAADLSKDLALSVEELNSAQRELKLFDDRFRACRRECDRLGALWEKELDSLQRQLNSLDDNLRACRREKAMIAKFFSILLFLTLLGIAFSYRHSLVIKFLEVEEVLKYRIDVMRKAKGLNILLLLCTIMPQPSTMTTIGGACRFFAAPPKPKPLKAVAKVDNDKADVAPDIPNEDDGLLTVGAAADVIVEGVDGAPDPKGGRPAESYSEVPDARRRLGEIDHVGFSRSKERCGSYCEGTPPSGDVLREDSEGLADCEGWVENENDGVAGLLLLLRARWTTECRLRRSGLQVKRRRKGYGGRLALPILGLRHCNSWYELASRSSLLLFLQLLSLFLLLSKLLRFLLLKVAVGLSHLLTKLCIRPAPTAITPNLDGLQYAFEGRYSTLGFGASDDGVGAEKSDEGVISNRWDSGGSDWTTPEARRRRDVQGVRDASARGGSAERGCRCLRRGRKAAVLNFRRVAGELGRRGWRAGLQRGGIAGLLKPLVSKSVSAPGETVSLCPTILQPLRSAARGGWQGGELVCINDVVDERGQDAAKERVGRFGAWMERWYAKSGLMMEGVAVGL